MHDLRTEVLIREQSNSVVQQLRTITFRIYNKFKLATKFQIRIINLPI